MGFRYYDTPIDQDDQDHNAAMQNVQHQHADQYFLSDPGFSVSERLKLSLFKLGLIKITSKILRIIQMPLNNFKLVRMPSIHASFHICFSAFDFHFRTFTLNITSLIHSVGNIFCVRIVAIALLR